MPRGGKRKGAGRKSAWNTGKTKAVKLPESLIPEIVEFAKTIDSTLVDGLYGQEKVDSQDRLVDILFDELDDRKILERVAKKLLTLSANEEKENQFLADPETTVEPIDASEYSKIKEADSHTTPDTEDMVTRSKNQLCCRLSHQTARSATSPNGLAPEWGQNAYGRESVQCLASQGQGLSSPVSCRLTTTGTHSRPCS